MKKLQIHPELVYRIPQFSFQSTIKEKWDGLKSSIANSSPEFYTLIKDCPPDEIERLPEAVQHTLWKYFNRARYRATPYADFAGVGLCRLSHSDGAAIKVNSKQILHQYPDWKQAEDEDLSTDELFTGNGKLMANSSYYQVGGQIRYIGRFEGKYELSEVPAEKIVLHVLEWCRHPLPVNELLQRLQGHFPGSDYRVLIASMLEDQLLTSELHPNLIGEDYFYRLGIGQAFKKGKYLIAERSLISGEVPVNIFKDLPSLIEGLYRILPSQKSPALSELVTRFLRKFGQREVPLMMALDPELGVGYGELERPAEREELMYHLLKPKDSRSNSYSWIALIQAAFASGLDQIDLEKIGLPDESNKEPIANSLAVLCSYASGRLQLDYISAGTANSLLGRFSLPDTPIRQLCYTIAQNEQLANPEVVFFDVEYAAGGAVDNVNRRAQIYPAQLSITGYNTAASPVTLDDVLVSVQEGKVVLTSQETGKRMVPKMATAYNYQLSDLPLFRFLSDLQYQDIHCNFSVRLRELMPGLSYYPRVVYKNIILSPKTWKMEVLALQDCSSQGLLKHCRDKAMPRYLKTGKGDQTLLIDTQDSQDVKALLHLLQKAKTLDLEEALPPSTELVQDEHGAAYCPQFVVTLMHHKNIYGEIKQPSSFARERPDLLPPGSEWLYYELYCHPQRADTLLLDSIAPFMKSWSCSIAQWFFIRYTENGHHLRVRLQLHSPEDAETVLAEFARLMSPYLQSGILSDLQIKTYKRETERYGNANLTQVENHFCKDTAFVLALMDSGLGAMEKYFYGIGLLEAIGQSGILRQNEYGIMAVQNMMAYNKEHGLQAPQFKELNKAYQLYLKEAQGHTKHGKLEGMMKELTENWILVLEYYPENLRAEILTAMFHMHVNRLFSSDQRTHETVMYYFLNKDLQRASGFSNNGK